MIGARHSKPPPAPAPRPFVIGKAGNERKARPAQVARPRRKQVVYGSTRNGQQVGTYYLV